MTLGQRIYQYRRANGLSQEELAESLNVSRQSVSKWETDGSIPDLDKMVALSELFGITLDELVKGSTPHPAPVSMRTEEADVAPQTASVEGEGSPFYEAFMTPEEYASPRPSEPFWCPRRVVGVILLSIALAVALLTLLFTWDVVGTLAFTSPLWLCGAICLLIRRHTVICCCWGALVGISSYLSLQTIFSFYNFNLITSVYAFLRFNTGPYASGISSEPLYLIIHGLSSLAIISLMVVTVMQFGRDPICVTGKTVKLFCIAAGGYLLLDVGIRCFSMEVNQILFVDGSNPWMNGWTYIFLRDVQGGLANLQNCMRPIAVTAVASVIASFCRETMKRL